MELAAVAVLVGDYRDGIAFFTGIGFDLVADEDRGGGKRWVIVRPPKGGAAILIARATGEAQREAIGRQAGGRVGFFLHTDDFGRDAARIAAAGGVFEEAPREENYGTVAVFRAPFGNRWDLIQPAP